MTRLLVGLAAVAALVSCTPKSNTTSLNNAPGVINGRDVKEKDPVTASIVILYDTAEKYLCTGSLITPNVVMTAAHCAPEKVNTLQVIFSTDLDDVLNSLEPDYKADYTRKVVAFQTSPSWDPKDETKQFDTGDIALLKFEGSLPAGYKPATFLATSDEVLIKKGTIATVAGYGVNKVDLVDLKPKEYRDKLQDAIDAGEVICDKNRTHCMKVEMSGDGILRQGQAPISRVGQTEVVLDERKSGTCSGDSGGPVYIFKDNQYYLFGVTSRASQMCNEYGVYTNALKYKLWILNVVNSWK